MYSRKFDNTNIPPGYNGTAYQNNSQAAPPHERRQVRIPVRTMPLKKPTSIPPPHHHESKPTEESKGFLGNLSILSKKNFTLEDILLAALIFLLLSNDADMDVILILGFLLIIGL
ncbi:MAG: hypothetical protein FWB93_05555 [Oscillospiraceae bacterium]|nr:hypothetical protein [Oscillospiraceae bacterium]